MLHWLALVLLASSLIGLTLLIVQCAALARHRLRLHSREPVSWPRVSILKPLCGMDDDLPENLDFFTRLDYPNYELILGVETRSDAAYPTALLVAKLFPNLVRVVVQNGSAGLNPKVNQLVSLAEAATGDIFVISDSNARAERGFLTEIVAHLEDPSVGLVAHPVVGVGESGVGATLDNMHLTTIGLGCVAAKLVAGKDVVVGKMMSLRRTDIEALGGFTAVCNVLAEDYVLGRWVPERLGKRVALAQTAVLSISRDRTTREFFQRYCRWSVMQRMAVGNFVYLSQLLLNPLVLAIAALSLAPSTRFTVAALCIGLTRSSLDGLTGRLLRSPCFGVRALCLSPLKDFFIGAAWLYGLTHHSVVWRGHLLRVGRGTVLSRAEDPATPAAHSCLDAASTPVRR